MHHRFKTEGLKIDSELIITYTMGRIKTTLIKRTAHTIIKKYPEKFTENFGENKKTLQEVADIQSKKLRNVIAGYITRLTRKQRLAA